MKIIYSLLLFTGILFFGQQVNAQCNISTSICFYDDNYFRYEFKDAKLVGLNIYASEGTCDAYGGPAYLTLDLTNGIADGKFKITVVNPYNNFCLLSDSFVNRGTVVITKGESGGITYTASGTFKSYCGGGVVNSGPWSVVTTCSNALRIKKPAGITPADGLQKINGYKQAVTISPNPAGSVANITYTIKEGGKVSLVIYNSMNQPVKTFAEQIKTPGTYTLQWDLLKPDGNKVVNGVYRAVVTTPAGILSGNVLVTRN